jgi:uncharacterized protein YcbK (DUF882 family)
MSDSNLYFIWKTGEKLQLSKNFSAKEFECREPHPSGEHRISKDLVQKLQQLRDVMGVSLTITSGYRHEAYNRKIGGASRSQHIHGNAADVKCADLNRLFEECKKIFPAVGDGRKRGFIHVDVRILAPNVKAPMVFNY